jgi:hypothetical protein
LITAFDFGAQVIALRQVQPRLGRADVLDRQPRHRDQQRPRVGVADVLGGEHDHPPRDEAGILAALEHRREVEHSEAWGLTPH